MPQKKPAGKPARSNATGKPAKGGTFTDDDRAAMKERIRELKAAARAGEDRAAGDRDVVAKIAAMPQPDRGLGERLHAIVTANAPDLVPRLWYGMPAYTRGGKVVCFFQSAEKFKT